jgi:hypothetical protein
MEKRIMAKRIIDLVVKEMAFDDIFNVKHERAFDSIKLQELYAEQKEFRLEYKNSNITAFDRIDAYDIIDEMESNPVDELINNLISKYN